MNRAQRRQQKKLAQKGVSAGSLQHVEALQKGIGFQQSGDQASAEQIYKQILQVDPENPEANHLMGTLAHQLGRHDLALAFLERAVSFAPNNANFQNMVGVVAKETGDLVKAENAHKKAIQIEPKFATAMNSLALLYKDTKRLGDARTCALNATKIAPQFAEAHNTLGSVLAAIGDIEGAISSYHDALRNSPDFKECKLNLALALQKANRLNEALELIQNVTLADPNFSKGHLCQGQLLRDSGYVEDSISSLQRAVETDPRSAENYYNLGLSLSQAGLSDDAIACYDGAIALEPCYAHAYNDRGVAYMAQGKSHTAISSFAKALELAPNSALMYSNLGNAYLETGELLRSKEAYKKALSLNSKLHQVHNNLGVLHQSLGEFAEAQDNFAKALELNPEYREVVSNMLFTTNYDPSKTGEEIFERYKWFNEAFCEPLIDQIKEHDNQLDPDRTVRVGYVGSTFYQHAVSYHLMPLFDLTKHHGFEVFAYADTTKSDAYTEQYKENSDHFVHTKGLTDEQLAERIREDEIDILVDIAGHTKNNRLGVFARRPAPVALHWLDFGYTTGMPTIDYYLGDHNVTPADQDHLFGEKEVWRLDGPSVVYRPRTDMGDISELPALENGHVTFCTLSRTVRLNDPTIRVWAEILKRVPGSKIRFDSRNFSTDLMCDRLADRFKALGIERDRLIMGFSTPPWNTLREIDIALDCFPHNSGTTLFEHLYMGNPYVTLYNRASVGTLGGAILRGGGFGEWVAHTEEEYVDIAVKLASDIPTLAETRRTMRDKMKASPLMDEKAFVARMEGAYREMWRRWCAEQ